MANERMDAAQEMLRRAQSMMGLTPGTLQMERYWRAHDGVLDAAESYARGWFRRRHDAATRRRWKDRAGKAAEDGLRLLALAMRHADGPRAEPYRDLTLVGLAGLHDPVRADVPDAVAQCRRAGVGVAMLTGDHAATARAIARAAGPGGGAPRVIEGWELDALDDGGDAADDLRDGALAADVFARVDPATKLTLVGLFQRAGHVVAMTGDGVNDAPALRKADIGVAMGRRGTQIARESADMVLRDDAFSTILAAMRQGRVIFGNIRGFVVYLMSSNVGEILAVGFAVGAGLPAPLLPLQILYLNIVTGGFPPLALGWAADPPA